MDTPIGIAAPHDGSGDLFAIERAGRVRHVHDGDLVEEPFLDIQDRVTIEVGEQGLLGIVFDPNYHENGYFYLNYTNLDNDTIIARYTASADRSDADPDSETIVLQVEQPGEVHNAGAMAFGLDGYLYIGLGDGHHEHPENGQDLTTLLGSILRIDVSTLPYTIPPDNPFVDHPSAQPEIWAYGVRNPWRFSIDRDTGDLWIADVGDKNAEEVSWIPAGTGGVNLGWALWEGFHCEDDRRCDSITPHFPEVTFDRAQGCAITGGHVYRGEAYPSLNGVYFFTDYCTATVWGLRSSTNGNWETAVVGHTMSALTSFGEDEAGELYVANMLRGVLYRVTAP